ncbi:UNVERIFIED_CONTAM: putative mitochondrial protein [Sesamum calycinum]|uniref:Mitochondrial protein n=1 Tax=Sesamum calycinum TaxID=2727403 RepID=A0AAW2IYH8_9LAMI
MKEKLASLEKNKTWSISYRLAGQDPIGTSWVYKVKLLLDGSVDRYKVRLVAKEYNQIEGVDNTNNFYHVAKANTQLNIYMVPQEGYAVPQGKICDTFLVFLVCVDDVLISGPSQTLIIEVKEYLNGLFTIKNLGYAKYILGIEIVRSQVGRLLNQIKYIRDIVQDTGLEHTKLMATPFPIGVKLTAEDGVSLLIQIHRRLLGPQQYLKFTRSDIQYAT